MYKCMNCGREYDGEFCPDCGTKRGSGKKCDYCGAVNAADDKFCRTGGTKFINIPNKSCGEAIPSATQTENGVQTELIESIKDNVMYEIIILSVMLALLLISSVCIIVFSFDNLVMYSMLLIMIIYLPCFVLNLVALIRCAKSRRALKPAVLPAIFVTVSTSIILCSVTFYVGFALSERWLYNIIIHLVTTILTCFMWKAWANANFYYKELIAYCSK